MVRKSALGVAGRPGTIRNRPLRAGDLVAVIAIAVMAVLVAAASEHKAPAAATKLPVIVVHTMPWFEARPESARWGWHWSMNAFDPEKVTEGKRSIASHY